MEQYDVFISYRRGISNIYARNLRSDLERNGFRVFRDKDTLRQGTFDTQLYATIESCKAFLLLLAPDTLDRCVNDGDWVRNEIAHALKCRKSIIPVMIESFQSFPEHLPADIAEIRRYQGVRLNDDVWEQAIAQLCEYVRDAQEMTVVDVMCPHCGAVSEADGTRGEHPIMCGACEKAFLLSEGARAFENHGFIIEDTTLVKYVGHAETLCIPDPDTPATQQIETIGKSAFEGHPALRRIDLSGETENGGVRVIAESAFYGCKALQEVSCPKNMTEIGARAFCECTALERITMPEHLFDIGAGVFAFCTCLHELQLPKPYDRNGWFQSGNGIPERICAGCSQLTQVVLPNNIAVIGSHAFAGCFSLWRVSYYDDSTEPQRLRFGLPPTVRRIENAAFVGCKVLGSDYGLCCPVGEKDHRPDHTDAFWLPRGLEQIGKFAFSGCDAIERAELPPRVHLEEGAFEDCTRLETVYWLEEEGVFYPLGGPVTPVSVLRAAFRGTPYLEKLSQDLDDGEKPNGR